MTDRTAPESYGRLLGNLVSVFAAVAVLTAVIHAPRPSPPAAVAPPPPPVKLAAPSRAAKPRPAEVSPPPASAPLKPDVATVARAQAALDGAARNRERAEARALEAAQALDAARQQAAAEAEANRDLSARLREPKSRIAQIASQGGFEKAKPERDRLKDEVAALRKAPRPRPRLLSDTSPVARPAGGEETHFEVRRDRVTFIDLERLMSLVKADALVRVRIADSRVVESQVGPVGAFSLSYTMGRASPGGIDDLMERRGVRIVLQGWELIPEYEGRGETFEKTRSPASQFALAINRINPATATITMWIYPDGFGLYRKLRDDLHKRGYLVAARPLPEAMTIRGSPSGSISAGQ